VRMHEHDCRWRLYGAGYMEGDRRDGVGDSSPLSDGTASPTTRLLNRVTPCFMRKPPFLPAPSQLGVYGKTPARIMVVQ